MILEDLPSVVRSCLCSAASVPPAFARELNGVEVFVGPTSRSESVG